MKKVKVIFQAFLLVLAGVILISGSIYAYKYYKVEENTRKSQDVEFINKLSGIIKKRWIEGDREGFWRKGLLKCEAFKDIKPESTDDSWLQCNPYYLDCFIKSNEGKVRITFDGQKRIAYLKKIKNDNYVAIETRKSSNHHLTPKYSAHLQFSFDNNANEQNSFLLEDVCKDTYLPQRIYGASLGGASRKFKYKWDNFNRHIFVDKYQVTNLDVNLWLQNTKTNTRVIKEAKKLSSPATSLSIEEMRNYCAFRGKELIQSHIFDAMSFHPGDESRIRSKYLVKRPFPWSKRKSKVFLYKAQKNKKIEINAVNCRKAFVKECLANYEYLNYDTRSASWSGTFQLLGGVMEVMANPIKAKQNLMLSSQYINASSLWNRLGKRVFWDGKDLEAKNFQFPEDTNLEASGIRFEVAFRCMKVMNEN